MTIAELCYDTILEYGVAAKIANEQHVVTEALEAVIEANTLMSGLGFENTACACAHAVGDGITATPNGTKTLHGEKSPSAPYASWLPKMPLPRSSKSTYLLYGSRTSHTLKTCR